MHVAAGALVDRAGRVLIAQRPARAHQGGLWEFPGGKLEAGESVQAALARELHEELGIVVRRARPLIAVEHAYADKAVRLDVWRIEDWSGVPHGREGQPLAWCDPQALDPAAFPAADVPVLAALRLPPMYLVTGEPAQEPEVFLARLDAALARGVRLVQLRAKTLPAGALAPLCVAALQRCRAAGARLLLNGAPALAMQLGADGVHLDARALAACRERPLPAGRLLAASCHDAHELAQARRIGCDFAVLGPLAATATHPEAEPLGWARFAALVRTAGLPVYALGGLGPADLDAAWAAGAQGVAAIRALWQP
ncbi:Nudix family hydrolase [Plasticicumulans sp.]|uniref:Nudix family hydrolase n=1 Tax=Plasticicumulans sp. TaxID=2307179 RepID=UPI003947D2C0